MSISRDDRRPGPVRDVPRPTCPAVRNPRGIGRALVLAAATVFLAGAAAPTADEFKPFVFIHTSDPEIGKPDVQETAGRFALLAQRAKALGAALVVVAGDVTHGSTDEELKAMEDALQRFTMPVKMVPGNHDTPAAFARHFGPDRYVFTLNNCDFACLNSNLAETGADSAAAKAQWQWLEETLKESRRRQRTHVFVVLHHPTVAGHEPLAGLLAKYDVKVVLAGHLHATQESQGKGYTTYTVSGTDRARDDKGLGYRVFKVARDRIEQEFVPLEKEP